MIDSAQCQWTRYREVAGQIPAQYKYFYDKEDIMVNDQDSQDLIFTVLLQSLRSYVSWSDTYSILRR